MKPAAGSASIPSVRIPDSGQTVDATTTFGEDPDCTIDPPSYTDNGNGTITDNVTSLVWQKVDAGESTWDNAVHLDCIFAAPWCLGPRAALPQLNNFRAELHRRFTVFGLNYDDD